MARTHSEGRSSTLERSTIALNARPESAAEESEVDAALEELDTEDDSGKSKEKERPAPVNKTAGKRSRTKSATSAKAIKARSSRQRLSSFDGTSSRSTAAPPPTTPRPPPPMDTQDLDDFVAEYTVEQPYPALTDEVSCPLFPSMLNQVPGFPFTLRSLNRVPTIHYALMPWRETVTVAFLRANPHVIVWCPVGDGSVDAQISEPRNPCAWVPVVLEYKDGCYACASSGRICIRVAMSTCLFCERNKSKCARLCGDAEENKVLVPMHFLEEMTPSVNAVYPAAPLHISWEILRRCLEHWPLGSLAPPSAVESTSSRIAMSNWDRGKAKTDIKGVSNLHCDPPSQPRGFDDKKFPTKRRTLQTFLLAEWRGANKNSALPLLSALSPRIAQVYNGAAVLVEVPTMSVHEDALADAVPIVRKMTSDVSLSLSNPSRALSILERQPSMSSARDTQHGTSALPGVQTDTHVDNDSSSGALLQKPPVSVQSGHMPISPAHIADKVTSRVTLPPPGSQLNSAVPMPALLPALSTATGPSVGVLALRNLYREGQTARHLGDNLWSAMNQIQTNGFTSDSDSELTRIVQELRLMGRRVEENSLFVSGAANFPL